MKTRNLLQFTLLFGLLALAATTGLAQEAAEAAAHEGGDSIFKTIKDGGPLIMSIWAIIIATSAIMVTLIIQNAFTLQNGKLVPPALVEALQADITAGNYQGAWETCNANNNYLANVLKAGLTRLGRGKEAMEDSIAEYSLREATVIRTRNSYLSVIGMIGAFAVLASDGITDPRALSGKIGEVLLATASGLFIAIPAFVAYYIFRNRAQVCIIHADDTVNNLIYDIPYEELSGIQIGDNFNPGAGAPAAGARLSQKVSAALTTNCPTCNGVITPGQTPCPHCGTVLQWQQ